MPFVYVASDPPAPQAEAIIVRKDSPLKTLADLRGKKVALNRGSNVHYLLLKALESAKLTVKDIEVVYLAPGDARPAYESGKVDAWVIWDPFLAAAEQAGSRALANGEHLVDNRLFYIARREFAEQQPDLLRTVLAEFQNLSEWESQHAEESAKILAESSGIAYEALLVTEKRHPYGLQPISDAVLDTQQEIANGFRKTGPDPEGHSHSRCLLAQRRVCCQAMNTPDSPSSRAFLPAILPWLAPLGSVLLWQLVSQLGWLPENLLPAPLSILRAGVDSLRHRQLLMHLAVSSGRAATGTLIGASIGLLLGLLTGLSRRAQLLLDGPLQMVRAVPALALVPLVIVWFGLGEIAKIFIVVITVIFPVYLNTFHGVRSVDPQLLEMARVYHLRGFALYRHVILPGALPSVLVGLRFALGMSWIVIIVAETLGASSGLGYLAATAREFMQTDILVLTIVLWALLGKAADLLARRLERWLLPWQPTSQRLSVE